MNHFFFFQFHIDSAKQFHGFRNRLKIYAYKICHIQIQIGIEHIQKLFGAAFCICSIRFAILTISFRIFANPQICITIYGNQFHFLGIIVDTCNNHSITVTGF